METNAEKLKRIAKPRSSEAVEKARQRRENRGWLKLSKEIVIAIHYYLRISNMTQKELAEKMNVSSAYITKILKGDENLTLETIDKIQTAIDKPLISVVHPYLPCAQLFSMTQTTLSEDTFFSDNYYQSNSNHDLIACKKILS